MGFTISHGIPISAADRSQPSHDRVRDGLGSGDPLRPPIRSLLTTPSAIIDPTGVMVAKAAGDDLPIERRARPPLLAASATVLLGFAAMHVLFVGGPYGGPLLSAPASVASEKSPFVPRQAKRAHTQPHEPTITGTLAPTPDALGTTHPLPPPRPRRI
jgi:hypothetical protein